MTLRESIHPEAPWYEATGPLPSQHLYHSLPYIYLRNTSGVFWSDVKVLSSHLPRIMHGQMTIQRLGQLKIPRRRFTVHDSRGKTGGATLVDA